MTTMTTKKKDSVVDLSPLLSSNIHLQRELSMRIQRVAQLKIRNRVNRMTAARAAENRSRSTPRVGEVEVSCTSSLSKVKLVELTTKLDETRNKAPRENDACDRKPGGGFVSAAPGISTQDSKTTRKRQRTGGSTGDDRADAATDWRRNHLRKWQKNYFADPEGSIPLPNEDLVRRRLWLHQSSLSDHLMSEKRKAGKAHVGQLDVSEISSKQKAPLISSQRIRAEEGGLILTIFVHNSGYPVWSSVPNTLQGFANRAAWDCFRYIIQNESILSSTAASAAPNAALASQPWRGKEDAVLLKAIAALGPQFVFSRDNATDLTLRWFCDRSVKQTKARANTSLVNPNYRSDKAWLDEEERNLVLLVRAYSNCASPLLKVFAHFPDRASKSVAEKWVRSLAPSKEPSRACE